MLGNTTQMHPKCLPLKYIYCQKKNNEFIKKMKFLVEIVLHIIAMLFLFIGSTMAIMGDNLFIGIVLIFSSFAIWGITAELEDNKKDTPFKKIILGLRIPILMITLIIVLTIAAYYQAVAYEKFGVLGYYAIGPIGICILGVIFLRLKEFLKNR